MAWRLALAVPACVGLLLSGAAPASAADEGARILPGFEIRAAGPILGGAHKDFVCPPVPEPVTDMGQFLSRYDPSDPTQSRVDPRRVEAMADREKRLKAFATQLSRLADIAVASTRPDPAVASCVWSQLAAWADAGALSADVENNDRTGQRVAVMMQAWQVTTYAAVALKVSGPQDGAVTDERKRTLAWMRGLIESGMALDAGPLRRLGANHLYWVGVGAAFMSALTQDRATKSFALEALRRGLDDVTPAGALDAEMRRGDRALMYQNFATLPLAMLVRFAEANGRDLSEAERASLLRLVRFSGDATLDPTKVDALAGKAQKVDPADRSALAWIDVILPSVARIDPTTERRLIAIAEVKRLGPSWHIYAGGALTAVYNPGRLRSLVQH